MNGTPIVRRAERALRSEAEGAGVTVEQVELLPCDPPSAGKALWQIVGHYSPTSLLLFQLSAPDGTRWAYAQPFSMATALPGEHHFDLAGAPERPLLARGPSAIDRNLRLRLALAALLCCTLIGTPLALLLLVALPRASKFEGGPEASIINPALASRRFAPRFGLRAFILPWVAQLHGLGEGRSRLCLLSPGTVRAKMTPRGEFGWAHGVARRAQTALNPGGAAGQTPAAPSRWGDVVEWRAQLVPPSAGAVATGVEGRAVDGRVVDSRVVGGTGRWPWGTLLAGWSMAAPGLLFAVGFTVTILDPNTGPKRTSSAVSGLVCSSFVCLLPGLVLILFSAWRLHRGMREAYAAR